MIIELKLCIAALLTDTASKLVGWSEEILDSIKKEKK